jgi:8-oxo-dGTP diphosphatase
MWITQKENRRMALPLTEVSCAVIMEGDRVLVTRRSEHMPHPLKWEFPGGKLKPGETPEACLIREIREELGVEISVVSLLPPVFYRYSHLNIKLIPFVCAIRRGKIELKEHLDYYWVPRSQLESLDWLEADIEVLAHLERFC